MPPAEASSLSALNTLADYPPSRCPDFEASFERRGLLLWIVRVPDSRDIILTPLHPVRGAQTATAADVAACMYYLHLHARPTPANPLPSATLIRRVPGSGDQWNVANIIPDDGAGEGEREGQVVLEMLGEGYRRLVRGGADAGPPIPPPPPSSGSSGSGSIARKPVGAGASQTVARKPVGTGASQTIARKPVGTDASQTIARKPVPGAPPPPATIDRLFKRVMHIEGAGFWDRMKARKHRKSHSRDPSESAGRVKKKRDYVFEGPWTDLGSGASSGRCEFKDQDGGRFLKCKYYPAPSPHGGQEKSTLLSVIEFNPRALGHRRSLSAPEDDETGLKAKMGMLVVHGSGQEMMDLLVAANLVAFMKRWEGWGKERAALGGW